jgi:hypothetical protein
MMICVVASFAVVMVIAMVIVIVIVIVMAMVIVDVDVEYESLPYLWIPLDESHNLSTTPKRR